MWVYEKRLEYPIKITRPNPALAKLIISQYGGPDGELGASLRYLSQRYSMPYPELKAILTDIGREELNLFLRKKSKSRDLTPTLSIILPVFILPTPMECLGLPLPFR